MGECDNVPERTGTMQHSSNSQTIAWAAGGVGGVDGVSGAGAVADGGLRPELDTLAEAKTVYQRGVFWKRGFQTAR